jgi:hypothetical protein
VKLVDAFPLFRFDLLTLHMFDQETSKGHSICSGEKTQVRLPRSFLKRRGAEIAEESRSLWTFRLCVLRLSAFPNDQKSRNKMTFN